MAPAGGKVRPIIDGGDRAALEELGVSPERIRLGGYDAGQRIGAPIAVGFKSYKAQGPSVRPRLERLHRQPRQDVNNNFGCATTANMAAMIANPADLLAPRQTDPADAGRRETILGKYRQGRRPRRQGSSGQWRGLDAVQQ